MSKYFWDNIDKYKDCIALITENESLSYEQISCDAKSIVQHVPSRSFVFLICKNCIASIVAYIGFLQKKIIPVLLNEAIDKTLFNDLLKLYDPQYIWCAEGFVEGQSIYSYKGYNLICTDSDAPIMNEDLAIMLTTSGSTGSPKFVRQTYKNIESNTDSIVKYLNIVPTDRAITTLPMSYTYGLSIIQSHLMAGAKIILTELTFFDRGFWNFFKDMEATTFGAVPYTYQMLDRLHFLKMDLPSIRYITQAGGRLGEELHYKFGKSLREKGKALVVMYGATEATARMSYVPAEKTVEKAGSIGIAIPGGCFELIDVDGSIITVPNKIGELVYYGDNVTLGYAVCREDLAKEDENKRRLETGDMAKRDIDGYYYVVGRKKRFLKIFGNRVNLVEIEDLLSKAGYEAACVGEDDNMRIYTTSNETESLVSYISEKTGLNRKAFEAIHIDSIPHNDSGKVLYSELK